MTFHKYPKIKRLGDRDTEKLFELPDDIIYIEEKVDGCFQYGMKITTNIGQIPIGEIVNKKLKVNVLSHNLKTHQNEYKPITSWYKNGHGEDWLKITYESDKLNKYLIVTPNHKIYDGIKFKSISEFNINDIIYLNTPKLTDIQKEVMLGSIIGDCSISNMSNSTKNPRYSETHSIKQKEYLEFKKKIFNNIISNWDEYINKESGEYKERLMCRIESKSIKSIYDNFNYLYENEKITLKNIYGKLTPLSIAIWYCDDGSISFSTKQRPRIALHTQAYSEYECNILIAELLRFDINSKLYNYGKGYQLSIGADDTEKFCELVSKYIPSCMNYKLPDKYKNDYVEPNLEYCDISPYKILNIEKTIPKSAIKYDIEVADNHNYFVKGMLVSNSNFRFMPTEDGRIVFGSRNQSIGDDTTAIGGGWSKCVNYILNILKDKNISKYAGYIFYGECCKSHSIQYDWDNIPSFIAYDIMKDDVFLSYDEKCKIFNELGFEIIKVVDTKYVSEISTKTFTDNDVPSSEYGNIQAEGIVLKNYRTQTFLKYVCQKFKEVNKVKFGESKKFCTNDNDKFIATYCTNARIDKHVFKLIDDGNELEMKLMQYLPSIIWNDIIEECAIEILNENWTLDFRQCRKNIAKRCVAVLEQLIQMQYVQNSKVSIEE